MPVWWSISREIEWLRLRVANWVAALAPSPVCSIDSQAVVGGGSLPGKVLPSCALVVRRDGISADELARRLRLGAQPIVPRIIDNQVAIDARTVLPEQDAALLDALRVALSPV